MPFANGPCFKPGLHVD